MKAILPPAYLLLVGLLAGRASVSSAVVIWGSSPATVFKPATFDRPTGIAAGHEHGLAIVSGGQVVGWGTDFFGQATIPSGLSNVVAVAAGQSHSLALRANGRVIGWGDNSWGQIMPPNGLSNVMAIAAGGYHSLALRSDGTVVAWGYNEQGQATVPADLEGVKAIAAGKFYSLALCSNGMVRAWGQNDYGQLEVPPTLTNAVAIGAGYFHALAVTAEGQVVQWGSTKHGQGTPPPLTNAIAVAAGLDYSLALRQDRTLVHWGQPLQLPPSTNAAFQALSAISCGHRYAMALQDNEPFLYQDLFDQDVYSGTPVTMVPGVNGPDLVPLWYYNGQRLSVSNAGWILSFNPVRTFNAGRYQLVATNAYGAVTSRVAELRVYQPGSASRPVFTTSPSSISVHPGQTGQLTAAAGGLQPISYQWQFEGQDIPGATAAILQLPEMKPGQSGWYRVVASNALGATTSKQAYVRVYEPLAILENPVSTTVYAGCKLVLRAKIYTPSVPAYCYWRKDGQVVRTQTVNSGNPVNLELSYTNATFDLAGNYELLVSNSLGIVSSPSVSISIADPAAPDFPGITAQPAGLTVMPGQPVSIPVMTIGEEPLTYQWQRDGVDVPGQSSRDLTLASAQAIDFGEYRLIVSNRFGAVISDPARLVLATPPSFFTRGPSDLLVRVCPGYWVIPGQLYFEARVAGSTPITTAWYCNGTNLTDPRFKLTGGYAAFHAPTNQYYKLWVTNYDQATFQCVASNAYGVTTSRLARLQIEYFAPPQLQIPVAQSPWHFTLSVSVQTNAYYTIESSTDFKNWEVWTNFYSYKSAMDFVLSVKTNQTQLYLRMLTPMPEEPPNP